jgi:hypothetical protein
VRRARYTREHGLTKFKMFQLGASIIILASFVMFTRGSVNVATPFAVVFDFDTALPTLSEGRSTPFNQTSDSIMAYFGSPSDPAAFSIQSYDTTFFTLSQFSGKYLYDNNPSRDILDIKFNVSITSINFCFATVEYHSGPVTEPSSITLLAYMNSAHVGSTTAFGSYANDSYPQGKLSFNLSGQPFNWVRISLPYQAQGASDFFVDSIAVSGTIQESPTPLPSDNATPSPSSTLFSSPSSIQSLSPSSSPQIPEFPPAILTLFIAVTVLAIFISKRKLLSHGSRRRNEK